MRMQRARFLHTTLRPFDTAHGAKTEATLRSEVRPSQAMSNFTAALNSWSNRYRRCNRKNRATARLHRPRSFGRRRRRPESRRAVGDPRTGLMTEAHAARIRLLAAALQPYSLGEYTDVSVHAKTVPKPIHGSTARDVQCTETPGSCERATWRLAQHGCVVRHSQSWRASEGRPSAISRSAVFASSPAALARRSTCARMFRGGERESRRGQRAQGLGKRAPRSAHR